MRAHLDFASLIMPIIKKERDADDYQGALYNLGRDGYQAIVSQVSLGEALAVLMKYNEEENNRRSDRNKLKRDAFDVFKQKLGELKPQRPPLSFPMLKCANSLQEKEKKLDTVDLLIVAHYACDVEDQFKSNNNPEVMLVTGDSKIIQNNDLKEAIKGYWQDNEIDYKVNFKEPSDLKKPGDP
jgi:hypothetical protein